jgi:hypothetical protein
MNDWKNIPDWVAMVFALGAILLLASGALLLAGFVWAGIGVVVGFLLLAIGVWPHDELYDDD